MCIDGLVKLFAPKATRELMSLIAPLGAATVLLQMKILCNISNNFQVLCRICFALEAIIHSTQMLMTLGLSEPHSHAKHV